MNDFLPGTDARLSTKDRISMATFNLLRENTSLNITISQICKAAGITKSTFYYYYHSIEEVIESFSDIISIKLSEATPEIFAQKTCIEQALLAIKVVDMAVEQLGPTVAASRYMIHLKEGDYQGFHAEAGWTLVLALMKKAIEVGEIPDTRPAEEVATSVFYIMRGVNHSWCMCGGCFPFTEAVQRELKIYFDLLQSSAVSSGGA